MEIKHTFPEDFLWGSATASYQVEGGIDNCDWALEAKRSGKVPVCGRACEHYSRYREDFDLAESMHHNAHRLSVEWARIEPEEGKFDEEAIMHYKEVFADLRRRNMHVSLTIWHFTLPIWFYEKGAFEKEESIQYFTRYAQKVIEEFKDYVDDFTTINEPMVYTSNGYIRGPWPPFRRTLWLHVRVLRNLAQAHNEIYAWKQKMFPDVVLGVVKDNIYFEGKNTITKQIARFLAWFWNDRFLNMIQDKTDFIGLNYYFHNVIGQKSKGPFNDMGWEIFPEGIYHMLIDLKKYNVPLYVTENGIPDEKDEKRSEFIGQHVEWVYRAIKEGAPVRGYFYWSLLDNYEWAHGFTKRFGLVEIDYDTMERTVRRSAHAYRFICEHNGF